MIWSFSKGLFIYLTGKVTHTHTHTYRQAHMHAHAEISWRRRRQRGMNERRERDWERWSSYPWVHCPKGWFDWRCRWKSSSTQAFFYWLPRHIIRDLDQKWMSWESYHACLRCWHRVWQLYQQCHCVSHFNLTDGPNHQDIVSLSNPSIYFTSFVL